MTDELPKKTKNDPSVDPELASDILRGAAEIATFLYGGPEQRRVVYNKIATTRFPHFRIGNEIHARKSVLMRWIEDQESRGLRFDDPSPDRG